MCRRVQRIASAALGKGRVHLPWSGTFHSVGAQLLRQHARQIGLKPSFTILDRSDAADLMNLVRHELGHSVKKARFPKKDGCLAIYSASINTGRPLEWVLAKDFPWCAEWRDDLRALFAEYVKTKQEQNVLDFDDLLLYWAEMLKDESLASEIGGMFDHVLVDEYQDTNRLQSDILLKLKPNGRGLMVVGDDAQAIYSFRGATVRNILDFPNQFDPPARIITIEQNYRSPQPILDACNKVIGLAKERFTKNLRSARQSGQKPFLTSVVDEAAQARYVANRVLRAREAGVPLKAQAVLFRVSKHSAQLEIELSRRNIPFVKYGGLKFLESAHIKDVLSVLRWCENPRDRVAGFRVLQLLPGIGPTTAARILDQLRGPAGMDSLSRTKVPRHTAEDWSKFAKLVASLRKKGSGWPAELVLVRRWYDPYLHENHDDAEIRAEDLAQLEVIAGGYESRQRFLTELTLDPPDAKRQKDNDTLPEEDDYLVLSTIHSAKGQEWRAVFVLNVVDGCIPSSKARDGEEIEEERRLLYVAMTRVKRQLDLIVPVRFFTYQQARGGDRHFHGSGSRFIPRSIQSSFERRNWQDGSRRLSQEPQKGHAVDVAGNIVRFWR